MNEDLLKIKVQKWIVFVSTLILIGKFIAYQLTFSVGILTDALESIVNVTAGAISLYSLRWAARPKDKDHPFGHGKMELLSASIEGMLIILAGGMIVFEGIKRLLDPVGIQRLDIGIWVIAIAGLLNYAMGWYSIRIGKKYQSMALVAGGKHLQSDTYSTIGLVAGLLVLYFTGLTWIDSALALFFGSIIIITGVSILKKTAANLLDKADEELLESIAQILNEKRRKEWIDIHNTKIIKYGSHLYIDCDLTIPWYYTIDDGHKSGEKLQKILQEKYANKISMTIHLDPCNIFEPAKCGQCLIDECIHRQKPFNALEKINLSNLTMPDSEINSSE